MKNNYYNFGKKILFPINRSITGPGIKKTLKLIHRKFNNFKIHKIKCGTKVYDWHIPNEWDVKNAFVIDKNDKKIIDFKKNNLHLVGYSRRINKKISKIELLKNLYSLKKQPNDIPYVTSYYKKTWGFCVTHKFKNFIRRNYKAEDIFRIYIDSKFSNDGNLVYGEYYLKGKSKKEILITTYICHPSMANNELSGPIVAMYLMNFFSKQELLKSIRFIFVPETIGTIAFINKNLKILKKNVFAGINLTCVGDERAYGFMPTKYSNYLIDKVIEKTFKKKKIKFTKYSFLKRGSDERQYNSPFIDIPMASIFRSKYHEYPEYHTSADKFEKVVTFKGIKSSTILIKEIIKNLQNSLIPIANQKCEPFLTKHKLYNTLSIKKNYGNKLLDILMFCDGQNNLDTISEYTKLSKKKCERLLQILYKKKLIKYE
jgi:aminopeptidase-like protein